MKPMIRIMDTRGRHCIQTSIQAETEKAFGIDMGPSPDSIKRVWVPKSVIKKQEEGENMLIITMPFWWLRKHQIEINNKPWKYNY